MQRIFNAWTDFSRRAGKCIFPNVFSQMRYPSKTNKVSHSAKISLPLSKSLGLSKSKKIYRIFTSTALRNDITNAFSFQIRAILHLKTRSM